MDAVQVVLKGGRERSLGRRHPWVFSGAVERVEGEPASGATVDVVTEDGVFLCRGAYSAASQIRVRVWSFDEGSVIDELFFSKRVLDALAFRKGALARIGANAYRVVNSEADGLPGVIVDRYGDFAVCQFLSAGAERWKSAVVSALLASGEIRGVVERADSEARLREGLAVGEVVESGVAAPELVEIEERGCRFLVDVRKGHKTGFYLDQRANRAKLGAYCVGGDVLNCFCYTGGFGVHAMKGGCRSLTNVESSGESLKLAVRNFELNGCDSGCIENVEGDVFRVLRTFRDSRRYFDVIVLDPPKFAESKGQLHKAARGYKDINLLALKLLRRGGILFTFSCSEAMDGELFRKVVGDAGLDAGREVRVLEWLTQGEDHPVPLSFPEAGYLKGLIGAVD